MNIKILSKDVSVSEQITLEDVQSISEAGYKTIVCQRPNGEAGDYPNFEEIQALAAALGLHCVHQPVVSGKISAEDGQQFKGIVDSFPTPIFAYCRTGTRSATLWTIAKSTELSADQILAASQSAGFDMENIRKCMADTECAKQR